MSKVFTTSGIELTEEEAARAVYFDKLHRHLMKQHAEKMLGNTTIKDS